MLTALLRRFSSRSQPVETPAKASAGLAGAAAVPAAPPKGLDQDLVYPPVDPGLPAASTEAVVQSQADLLRRLRKIVSVDDAVFDERYLAPIRALAAEIHLLPASAHDEFAGPGGLFRLCLEVAVFSTQAADGRIFTPDENVERRHALEPRWKYACFLAGLTCELYRPLAFAVVAEKFIRDLDLDREKVNINGGAMALGHPIGATGSILIGTALDELERSGGRYGLVTMCAAGGMAPAIIIERI